MISTTKTTSAGDDTNPTSQMEYTHIKSREIFSTFINHDVLESRDDSRDGIIRNILALMPFSSLIYELKCNSSLPQSYAVKESAVMYRKM